MFLLSNSSIDFLVFIISLTRFHCHASKPIAGQSKLKTECRASICRQTKLQVALIVLVPYMYTGCAGKHILYTDFIMSV